MSSLSALVTKGTLTAKFCANSAMVCRPRNMNWWSNARWASVQVATDGLPTSFTMVVINNLFYFANIDK